MKVVHFGLGGVVLEGLDEGASMEDFTFGDGQGLEVLGVGARHGQDVPVEEDRVGGGGREQGEREGEDRQEG